MYHDSSSEKRVWESTRETQSPILNADRVNVYIRMHITVILNPRDSTRYHFSPERFKYDARHRPSGRLSKHYQPETVEANLPSEIHSSLFPFCF